MSKPTGATARHEDGGQFSRTCPECGKDFQTSNFRTRYCCYKCKEQHNNRAFYTAHKPQVVRAVVERARIRRYEVERAFEMHGYRDTMRAINRGETVNEEGWIDHLPKDASSHLERLAERAYTAGVKRARKTKAID